MTDEELKRTLEAIRQHDEFVMSVPGGARLSLIALGTHRADGRLHENYGGDPMTPEEKAQHGLDAEAAEAELAKWREARAGRRHIGGCGI